jgi:hypothetical protein
MSHEMSHEIRTLKIGVCRKGYQIFDDSMTEIEIIDEAAGEFLKISQCSEHSEGSIQIEKEEWPTLKAAIDKMFNECRNYE